jgi:predicted nucleic acid-binding protein
LGYHTVTYYLQEKFPLQGEALMDSIVNDHQPTISIITEIELLCYKPAKEEDLLLLNNFIANSVVYELDQNIKLKTIEVRKLFKLKHPDAIIAASALVNNAILISRNVSDFNRVGELEVVDPFNTR